jgi:hypothetical protein
MAGLCALMTFKKGNQLRARPALERFAEKCRFDPATGCVLWIGGTTAGRGNSALYGSFWFEGSRWFTHRWSAIHIHGIDLGDNQAGHCCPHGPNTLCVEHVTGQTNQENQDEKNERRRAKVEQSNAERQYYLLVQVGAEPAPPAYEPDPDAVPFYEPPEWFKPFMPKPETDNDDCPF